MFSKRRRSEGAWNVLVKTRSKRALNADETRIKPKYIRIYPAFNSALFNV
jgi:hypothetical protein